MFSIVSNSSSENTIPSRTGLQEQFGINSRAGTECWHNKRNKGNF